MKHEPGEVAQLVCAEHAPGGTSRAAQEALLNLWLGPPQTYARRGRRNVTTPTEYASAGRLLLGALAGACGNAPTAGALEARLSQLWDDTLQLADGQSVVDARSCLSLLDLEGKCERVVPSEYTSTWTAKRSVQQRRSSFERGPRRLAFCTTLRSTLRPPTAASTSRVYCLCRKWFVGIDPQEIWRRWPA
jgi:hypothetical protein